jgi:very-short-patch-repair endonuclease
VVLGGVPGTDAGEWEWLLFRQAGVVTSAQAVRHLGRSAVRTRLRQHRWRPLCRGIVLTGNGRLTRDQQLWVAVLAAGPDAHLAGLTAAAVSGVRHLRPAALDVLVAAPRTSSTRLSRLPPDMPPVRVHRTTVLPPGHRHAGLPPRTTVARAVVDAAAWARGDDEARTIVAAACQQRRVTTEGLRRVLEVLPRVRRRRLIATTIADVAGGAGALSEIDLVELCRRHRLPRPDLQERRTDAGGRTRYLDAYWREWRLHVEVDGAHHMDAVHWAADMLRQNAVWITGDRILRFPAWLLRSRPEAVAAQLRDALRAAGWNEPTP